MAESDARNNRTFTEMGLKYCPCGHSIGVETVCDPPRFYDQHDWNAPVTHCPACNVLLTVDMLVYSEEQEEVFAKAYAYLMQRRRVRLAREKLEREAKEKLEARPLDAPQEQSSDDAPGQPTEELTTTLPDVPLLHSSGDETDEPEYPVSAPTPPPLDLLPFTPLAATLPGTALFLTVSGAHLYGFPSTDSDVDLRGVFILPQRALLGLDAPEETFAQTMRYAGYEVDLVTHDVEQHPDLRVAQPQVCTDQRPRGLARAANELIEEFDEQQDQDKQAQARGTAAAVSHR